MSLLSTSFSILPCTLAAQAPQCLFLFHSCYYFQNNCWILLLSYNHNPSAPIPFYIILESTFVSTSSPLSDLLYGQQKNQRIKCFEIFFEKFSNVLLGGLITSYPLFSKLRFISEEDRGKGTQIRLQLLNDMKQLSRIVMCSDKLFAISSKLQLLLAKIGEAVHIKKSQQFHDNANGIGKKALLSNLKKNVI